jgi:hypothetical protein
MRAFNMHADDRPRLNAAAALMPILFKTIAMSSSPRMRIAIARSG